MLSTCKAPMLSKHGNGAFPVQSKSGGYFLQDVDVDDSPARRTRKDILKALRCVAPGSSASLTNRDDDESEMLTDSRLLLLDYETIRRNEETRRSVAPSKEGVEVSLIEHRSRPEGRVKERESEQPAGFVSVWPMIDTSFEEESQMFERPTAGDDHKSYSTGPTTCISQRTAHSTDEETRSGRGSLYNGDLKAAGSAVPSTLRHRPDRRKEKTVAKSALSVPRDRVKPTSESRTDALFAKTRQTRRSYARSSNSYRGKNGSSHMQAVLSESSLLIENIDKLIEKSAPENKGMNRSLPSLLSRIEKLEMKLKAEGMLDGCHQSLTTNGIDGLDAPRSRTHEPSFSAGHRVEI